MTSCKAAAFLASLRHAAWGYTSQSAGMHGISRCAVPHHLVPPDLLRCVLYVRERARGWPEPGHHSAGGVKDGDGAGDDGVEYHVHDWSVVAGGRESWALDLQDGQLRGCGCRGRASIRTPRRWDVSLCNTRGALMLLRDSEVHQTHCAERRARVQAQCTGAKYKRAVRII